MKCLWLLTALTALIFLISACEDQPLRPDNQSTKRSADPCETWAKPGWDSGAYAIITPELRNGQASHMPPAMIIYYCIQENSDQPPNGLYVVNPVLILTYLEKQDLLSRGQEYGDFELRLLQACGFGGENSKKYTGFYPQLVSATYQWRRYQERQLSFDSAQVLYSFKNGDVFKEKYANYANIMNGIAHTNFALHPDSKGYYQDFFGAVSMDHIQTFLEAINSPLKDINLFQQAPVKNTALDYANPQQFCE